jgi:hypothetical protein
MGVQEEEERDEKRVGTYREKHVVKDELEAVLVPLEQVVLVETGALDTCVLPATILRWILYTQLSRQSMNAEPVIVYCVIMRSRDVVDV